MNLKSRQLFIVLCLLLSAIGFFSKCKPKDTVPENSLHKNKTNRTQAQFGNKGDTTNNIKDSNLNTVAGNITDFSFKLYQEVSTNNPGNIIVSPYSISLALAMLLNGAANNTEAQIRNALNFRQDNNTLNKSFQLLQEKYKNYCKEDSIELKIANSIWLQKEYPIEVDFKSLSKDYYNAQIDSVDFKKSPEFARTIINKWVEKETDSKIKSIFEEGMITEFTRAVIVDAISFYGKWAIPFQKELTINEPFYLNANKTIQAKMMRRTGSFEYLKDTTYQLIKLDYQGKSLSMLVILPNKKIDISNIENKISSIFDKSNQLLKHQVEVSLPILSFMLDLSVQPILEKLGMKDAFSKAANLTKLSKNAVEDTLYVSSIRHKAWVEISEEGTKAAAATGVAVSLLIASAPVTLSPEIFKADHPFLFIISDNTLHNILFYGRVNNPNVK